MSDWDLQRLGQWSEPVTLDVTRERIAAYAAAATNDEHPRHRSGELAPPVFAVVGSLVEAVAPALMAVVPAELAMSVVHGEQDFRYHAPILPGQSLRIRAAPLGVHGTSTGVVVLGKGTTETAAGELLVEQYTALFFRGAQLDVHEGEALTEHRFVEALRATEPIAAVTQAFDVDQTWRYSEASGDRMPIHLDDSIARSVGLPGIIVHGLCTMAFCGRAVVDELCPEDPTRLTRLAVRFAKVVQPSETITTSLYRGDGPAVPFETVSESGATVIKDGLAEVAD